MSSENALRTGLPPFAIMHNWRVGSAEHSWLEEARLLWTDDADAMQALSESIAQEGVREPVLLGDDGRVWDGHHRIVAAAFVDRTREIPVEYGHGGSAS